MWVLWSLRHFIGHCYISSQKNTAWYIVSTQVNNQYGVRKSQSFLTVIRMIVFSQVGPTSMVDIQIRQVLKWISWQTNKKNRAIFKTPASMTFPEFKGHIWTLVNQGRSSQGTTWGKIKGIGESRLGNLTIWDPSHSLVLSATPSMGSIFYKTLYQIFLGCNT